MLMNEESYDPEVNEMGWRWRWRTNKQTNNNTMILILTIKNEWMNHITKAKRKKEQRRKRTKEVGAVVLKTNVQEENSGWSWKQKERKKEWMEKEKKIVQSIDRTIQFIIIIINCGLIAFKIERTYLRTSSLVCQATLLRHGPWQISNIYTRSTTTTKITELIIN